MRTVITISAVTAFFAFSMVASSARVDEATVEKQDLKSVAIAPIATPRDGKNVALTLEVGTATSRRLPRGIAIGLNGKQLDLLDDGSWPDAKAGDGIYTLGLKTRDGKPLKEGGALRLSSAPSSEHHSRPLSCTFRQVDCGPGCKSFIFRSKCVICFVLESCEI